MPLLLPPHQTPFFGPNPTTKIERIAFAAMRAIACGRFADIGVHRITMKMPEKSAVIAIAAFMVLAPTPR
jgi:hypothetical protein